MRDSRPDYSIGDEALLRIFCLWVLPTGEALAYLDCDRSDYVRRLDNIEKALANKDWAANPTTQIAAGTLQPGGPLPPARWPAD